MSYSATAPDSEISLPAARLNAAMLKYLRIAVTALSLTACVLLIALWVRSYWSDGLMAFRRTHGMRSVCERELLGQSDLRSANAYYHR